MGGQSRRKRGRSANAMLITGAVAGVVVLAVGAPPRSGSASPPKKQRKQRRAEAGLDLQARLDHIGPALLRNGAGLSLSGRF